MNEPLSELDRRYREANSAFANARTDYGNLSLGVYLGMPMLQAKVQSVRFIVQVSSGKVTGIGTLSVRFDDGRRIEKYSSTSEGEAFLSTLDPFVFGGDGEPLADFLNFASLDRLFGTLLKDGNQIMNATVGQDDGEGSLAFTIDGHRFSSVIDFPVGEIRA